MVAVCEHAALTQAWAVKVMWVCWKTLKRLWMKDRDAAVEVKDADDAIIQSRGGHEWGLRT